MADDVTRRRFFRRFTSEAVAAAATVAGAASELQRASAEAAGLAEPEEDVETPAPAAPPGPGAWPWPAPYHEVDGAILLLDSRPGLASGTYRRCGSAVDVARAIRDGTIRGAPLAAQVAALALAITADQVVDARPWVRRNALRAAEDDLIQARPSSPELRTTVGRVLGPWRATGEIETDGQAAARSIREAAEEAIADAADARGELGVALARSLTPGPGEPPRRVMIHGEVGWRGNGAPAPVLEALRLLHGAGAADPVWLAVTGASASGARSVVADLDERRIPYRKVDVESIATVYRSGSVDVLLLAAECVAADGSVAADPGAGLLAVAATHHGIHVVVGATRSALDDTARHGASIATGAVRAGDRPIVDLLDAALITIVTNGAEGVDAD